MIDRQGLVEVRTVVPDALVDLRYATTDNFTGEQLYPSGARCWVHQDLADGLRTAADLLRAQGYRLLFWDAYRPHAAQVRMFEIVPDPVFVAHPADYARSHEAGRSVDVTVVHADGSEVDMGTGFDSFTPQAAAHATDGVSPAAQASRGVLREAMARGGLAVYDGEWWHFDGPGAFEHRPILTAPLE